MRNSPSNLRLVRRNRVGLSRRSVPALVAILMLVVTGCSGITNSTGTVVDGSEESSEGYSLSATAGPDDGNGTDGATAPSTTPPMTATSGASAPTGSASESDSADAAIPTLEFPDGIVPVRIEIPAIGVDAAVIDLDLRGATPEVPEDFGDTGWYEQTRLPGEIGPAVIAGHVDSVSGPAVFARLSLLEVGDEIIVTAADGAERNFEVAASGQYPKTELPDEVFGFGRPMPELRLITCGGTFDRSVRHYVDNFVIYAVSSSHNPNAL